MSKTAMTTLFISVVGGLIGTAGLTLSILNYLRDRPGVRVSLQWDMSITPTLFESQYDHRKPWGLIRVTNVGRRPICISAAALEYFPSSYERIVYSLLRRLPRNDFCAIIDESISGKKLSEGDPPQVFLVTQEGMERHCGYWLRVRVFVEDSAGKKYFSRPVDRCPSWAGGAPWVSVDNKHSGKQSHHWKS